MNKRINVILPTATVAVLNRVTTKGNRSALIDRAMRHYVKSRVSKTFGCTPNPSLNQALFVVR